MSDPRHHSLTVTLVVVALPAEARPLLDHWRLQRVNESSAFPVYRNREQSLWLIVSGIGKTNAAAAVAHLYHCSGAPDAVWINTGIAGHSTMPLGKIFIAHSITNSTGGYSVYPPLLFKLRCTSENLLSVDVPCDTLPEGCAVDMEASAFHSTATRYSSAECVQCLKVVSDNADNTLETVSAEKTCGWMAGACGALDDLREALLALVQHRPESPAAWPTFLDEVRFSVTQRRQVDELLRRFHALNGDIESLAVELPDLRNSRSIIEHLRSQVDAQSVHYER
ncbi:MAG: hypothetical protein AAF420_10755 [Pseudomonadota bacterium]